MSNNAVLTGRTPSLSLPSRQSRSTSKLTPTKQSSASAYLAFFFTDCLMSRWLLNYTPEATLIRLSTITAIFTYSVSWAVYLTGGTHDPSLLLLAWIAISAALTACYTFTQRKVPIRKETRLSLRVFSIASFISMVALLVHSHATRLDAPSAPDIPLLHHLRTAADFAGRLAVGILGVSREVHG
jgi:hypothetical protein